MKKVTAPEIFELIAGHTEELELPRKVHAALTTGKFEGKKITKRIATAVEKALPGHTVSYSKEYGMFHVSVWGKGIEFGERKRFLIGYHSHPVFTAEAFEKHNTCYLSAAKERNESRLSYLSSGKAGELAEAVNTVNEAVAKLRELLEECPEKYSVEELVNVSKLGLGK